MEGRGERREKKGLCCYLYCGFDFKTVKEGAFALAPCGIHDGIAVARWSLSNLLSFVFILCSVMEGCKRALPSGCSWPGAFWEGPGAFWEDRM